MKRWSANEIDSSVDGSTSRPYLSTRSGKRRRLAVDEPTPTKCSNQSRLPPLIAARNIDLPKAVPLTVASPPPSSTRTRLSLRSAAVSTLPYRNLIHYNRISSKLSVRERVALLNARDNSSRSPTPVPIIDSYDSKLASQKSDATSDCASSMFSSFPSLSLEVSHTILPTSSLSLRAGTKRGLTPAHSTSPTRSSKRVRFAEEVEDNLGSVEPTQFNPHAVITERHNSMEEKSQKKTVNSATTTIVAHNSPEGATRKSQRNSPSPTFKPNSQSPSPRRSPRLQSLGTSASSQSPQPEKGAIIPERRTTRALSIALAASEVITQNTETPSPRKGRWLPIEDETLISIVLSIVGPLPWVQITEEMAKQCGSIGRTKNAIRYRWNILKGRVLKERTN